MIQPYPSIPATTFSMPPILKINTRWLSDTPPKSSDESPEPEAASLVDDVPFPDPASIPISEMTNEQLMDNSTIPGWHLIHSPPRKFPRGALIGKVVSTKMQKTINVAVNRYKIAPKVRKRVRYTRKFMAHDEEEVACEGDIVMIIPCHRISKMKHFMLREIIRAKGVIY
jgi:small subunit ribosomal protein S17